MENPWIIFYFLMLNISGRALEVPGVLAARPRLLPSWCVIGSCGTCLVWKQQSSVRVDKFHLYYQPVLCEPR